MRINKISSEFKKLIFELNDFLETRNVAYQLNLSVNLILQLLSDIENAVTFAKVVTFHGSILKIDEVRFFFNSVIEFYGSDNSIFLNLEEDFRRYYDFLELEAYFSGTKIVFPIVYPEKITYLFWIPKFLHNYREEFFCYNE